MIKVRTLLSVIFCLATMAGAQTPGQGRGNGAGPLAMLQRVRQILPDLNLTIDEQLKIDKILEQARQDAGHNIFGRTCTKSRTYAPW